MICDYDKILLRVPLNSINKVLMVDYSSQSFQVGLYLSSPIFWQNLNSGTEKSKSTSLKYWIRSCTRCTPFANFAGVGLVSLAEVTEVVISDRSKHTFRNRIDNYCISLIVEELIKNKEIRNNIGLYPNNSIYKTPTSCRYTIFEYKENERVYAIAETENTDLLMNVLQYALNGRTINELSEFVAKTMAVDIFESRAYVEQLIEHQILRYEIEPPVTGESILASIIGRIEPIKGTNEVISVLKRVNELLMLSEERLEVLTSIDKDLRELISIPNDRTTLQTDTFLAFETATIQENTIKTIVNNIGNLCVFFRRNDNRHLSEFIKLFLLKYESAEIPLALALDNDLGIGYAGTNDETTGGHDLIASLAMPVSEHANQPLQDYISHFTMQKYDDFISNNSSLIEVTDADLDKYRSRIAKSEFPTSMYIMGSLIKKSNCDSSDTFHFRGMGGPSGANIAGRFAYGNGEIRAFVDNIIMNEERQNPNAIFAEIVHLPEPRLANILYRPILRKHELAYVGNSGAPIEDQIHISDIFISVQNGQIVLRSKIRNKTIIPRLTTAHNYQYKSLPVYKFLCDLQNYGCSYGVLWDWGSLEALSYLPRVIYKNVILRRARWILKESILPSSLKTKEDYFHWIHSFRNQRNLPVRIVYVEGDNELMLDLNCVEHIEVLISFIRKYGSIAVEEFLFTNEDSIVTDENGHPYTNEILIPVRNNEAAVETKINVLVNKESNVQRKFPPGSNWIYFKVYCGTKQAESILTKIIFPFVRSNSEIEKFYFVRYKDDFPHLRIRLYSGDLNVVTGIQQKFLRLMHRQIQIGNIDKIIIDTYVREIERYGNDLIDDIELFFSADSFAVLQILDILSNELHIKKRLFVAIKGIDSMLNDFELPLTDKIILLKGMQSTFFNEFGAEPALLKQLNSRYRTLQREIFSILSEDERDLDGIRSICKQVFSNRSIRYKNNVCNILNRSNTDNSIFYSLLQSLIHMFMNRLFISKQRHYELFIYHFLLKYYTSLEVLSENK